MPHLLEVPLTVTDDDIITNYFWVRWPDDSNTRKSLNFFTKPVFSPSKPSLLLLYVGMHHWSCCRAAGVWRSHKYHQTSPQVQLVLPISWMRNTDLKNPNISGLPSFSIANSSIFDLLICRRQTEGRTLLLSKHETLAQFL